MSEVNYIPEGWVETTLGDITTYINRGVAPKYSETNGIFVLNQRCIRDGKVMFENSRLHDMDAKGVSDQKIIQDGDVLICSTGVGTLGRVGQVMKIESKTTVDSHVTIVRGNHEINSSFLGLLLRGKEREIEHLAEGSTGQTELPRKKLETFSCIIPNSKEEQKSIAAILTAFDDKIELLQAQNKTLEETAQTIFKEWFGKYQIGDDLPEGWRVGVIGDLTEIKRGGSPRPIQDYISDSGYRWLKISDATATSSPYIFEIKEHIRIEGLNKTTLKKSGDLVLSNSATPGMPKILAVDSCVHDGWMHFPSSKVSNEYLYLLFLHIRPGLVQQGSGSVFVNLKTDILRHFETVIPSNETFNEFDKLIKPVFDKIYNNAIQIQTLTQTRDTLLPKLMSGEIRIKEFQK